MRPPIATIPAPAFPTEAEWINSEALRTDRLGGREEPVALLIEFWDFCRVNSLRTLPYLRAWHERYANSGLRLVGAHASGFEPSRDPEAVRAAVGRLQIRYPVMIDAAFELWQAFGVNGWPSRYLFGGALTLEDFHIGEGGYLETERAIQRLLHVDREPLAPLRPEDEPDAELVPQSADQPGPWSGRYAAGGVWGVLEGEGVAHANGRTIAVSYPGCYALVEHARHTENELELELEAGVSCHAVCFTPGLAPR
ncbi:MAG: redoxin domain-containing protein [Solirubrobacteraceae bacterium]|nr:MAG: DipZ protein [Solirubrobacterales bacterium]